MAPLQTENLLTAALDLDTRPDDQILSLLFAGQRDALMVSSRRLSKFQLRRI